MAGPSVLAGFIDAPVVSLLDRSTTKIQHIMYA